MSLFQEFITVIASGLFGLSEEPINKKIIPKMEFEDVELGNVTRKMKEINNSEKYVCCEFKSAIQNPDLELGFGPIVEINSGNVIVDMNAFEKCRIYENYVSFMESISYVASPFKDSESVCFKDVYPSWNRMLTNSEFHVILHIESQSIGVKMNKSVM